MAARDKTNNAVPYPQYEAVRDEVQKLQAELRTLRSNGARLLKEVAETQRRCWDLGEETLQQKASYDQSVRRWAEETTTHSEEEASLNEKATEARERLLELRQRAQRLRRYSQALIDVRNAKGDLVEIEKSLERFRAAEAEVRIEVENKDSRVKDSERSLGEEVERKQGLVLELAELKREKESWEERTALLQELQSQSKRKMSEERTVDANTPNTPNTTISVSSLSFATPAAYSTPCTDFGTPLPAAASDSATPEPMNLDESTMYTNALYGARLSDTSESGRNLTQTQVKHMEPVANQMPTTASCEKDGEKEEKTQDEDKMAVDSVTEIVAKPTPSTTPGETGVLESIPEGGASVSGPSKGRQGGKKRSFTQTQPVRRSSRLASQALGIDLLAEDKKKGERDVTSDGESLDGSARGRKSGGTSHGGLVWVREASPQPSRSGNSGRLQRVEYGEAGELEVQSSKALK